MPSLRTTPILAQRRNYVTFNQQVRKLFYAAPPRRASRALQYVTNRDNRPSACILWRAKDTNKTASNRNTSEVDALLECQPLKGSTKANPRRVRKAKREAAKSGVLFWCWAWGLWGLCGDEGRVKGALRDELGLAAGDQAIVYDDVELALQVGVQEVGAVRVDGVGHAVLREGA